MNERWCIVGPTHPFRGGIPRHTTLLGEATASRNIDLQVITFTRQYPSVLYKGASDRDPDQLPPVGFVPHRMLDSVGPASWFRAARAIAAARPDVVLAVWWHPFFAPMYGTLLRQVRRQVPEATRLALCHNVLPHETSIVDRILTRAALAPVEGLIVHAESQREVATKLLGPKPTLVTPHPTYVVDAEVRTPPRTAGDGPVTLLFFGLVRPYKGLDVLLRALPAVVRKRNVRLIVAGEFWDPVESYATLVDDLGMRDHVDLRPGYVPEPDLVKLLGAADLVVAPYRSATQSGVVEMAFGAGVPVVASRVGGLSEQVDHRVDGLLVEPGDATDLAAALIAATDADTLRDLGRAAGSHASGRTWDSMVDAISQFAGTVRGEPAPHPDATPASPAHPIPASPGTRPRLSETPMTTSNRHRLRTRAQLAARQLADVVPPGLSLTVVDAIEGRSGEAELRLLPALVRPGQGAGDVGANRGLYARRLARLCSHVIAFEPQPRLAARLAQAMPDNVFVMPVALSGTVGETTLRVPVVGSVVAHTRATLGETDDDHRELTVLRMRLDDLGLTSLGFMKIDVEGHETEMLEGAFETLDRCHPRLVIECDAELGSHPSAIEALLAPLGYEGWFHSGGAIHPLVEFDVDVHQRDRKEFGGPRPASEVRNFIFIPKDDAPAVTAALRHLAGP